METKYVNECGDVIPENIAKKAIEMGCNKPKYIYKDSNYCGKFPASNLFGSSHRFSNAASAEAHKVSLGDGWVVFKSPSGSGSRTSKKSDQW